jgi:S1-C subfamily serine protease
MDKIRNSILQCNVICSELDEQDPRKIVCDEEYTGTCFQIDPFFLKKLPFYSENDKYFLTNFHVCDDANQRNVYLRSALMGKSMFTSKVVAVVPKLDVAVLAISQHQTHEKWFSDEDPLQVLHSIDTLTLHSERITNKTRKVYTIGFPHGLQNQLSSGWLAGRGSDEEDMLELNLSLNSGNSGGPLADNNNNIIGVCCSTLGCAEAISFAVPSYCIIKYFQNFYSDPYGTFPQFGIKTIPMTPAYKKKFNINGIGPVVHTVHPLSIYHGKIKSGDVIHAINGRKLDTFGLMKDETRGCKITIDTTEFILGLEKCDITVSTKANKRTVKQMPKPLPFKVKEHFKEWCPLKVLEFGPFVFTNLSKTSLAEDTSIPAQKRLSLLETVRRSHSAKEIVIITKIDPNSYVASFENPEEYDQVLSVNRTVIKNMACMKKAIEDIHRMKQNGEKYFNIKTSSGNMWFTIDKVLTKKRKRIR